MASPMPPVVLFGYDCKTNCSCQRTTQTDTSGLASPFTQKVRLVLKLKQIPYSQHPLFHITMIMRNLSSSFHRCPKHDASSCSEGQFSFDVSKDSCPRNWSRGIKVIPLYLLINAHCFSSGLLRYFIDNRSSGAP